MADDKYSIQIEIDPKTQGARVIKKDLQDVAKEAKKTSSAVKIMRAAILAAIGVASVRAVASLTKSIVVMGATFEKTMATVGGVSRATAGELQELTDVAKQMGATTEFTANQAAQGLQFLAMAGFTVQDSIAALPGVLDLATAGQLDLGRASDIVTDSLTAMGLEVSDLGRLNDVFIGTITRSNTNVQLLGESFKYAAPIASQLGVQVESLAAMFGTLANAGIKGSDAGTDLRQALLRTAGAAKKLGLQDGATLVDVLEELERKQAGVNEVQELFGIIATKSVLVLKSNIEKYKELNGELGNSKGEAKELADTMRNTLSGSYDKLTSALSATGMKLFDWAKGPLKAMVDGLTDAVTGVNNFLGAIEKVRKEMAIDPLKPEGVETTRQEIERLNKTIDIWEKKLKSMPRSAGPITHRLVKLRAELAALKQGMTDAVSGADEFQDKMGTLRSVGRAAPVLPTNTAEVIMPDKDKTLPMSDMLSPKEYADNQKRITEVQVEENEKRREANSAILKERMYETLQHEDEMTALMKKRTDQLKADNKSVADSMRESLKSMSQEYGDMGAQLEGATRNMFSGMEDSLMSYIKTGELSFEAMTNAILEDLQRIMIRALIIKPIIDAIRGWAGGGDTAATKSTPNTTVVPAVAEAKGGVFGGGGLHAFAKGGIVGGPTLFPFAKGTGLMGEAGPEAIMPLTRTSNGELGVKSEGGKGGVVINVEVVKGDSEDTQVQQSSDSTGLINTMIIAVGADIINGGTTAGAIEGRFGVSAVPQSRGF